MFSSGLTEAVRAGETVRLKELLRNMGDLRVNAAEREGLLNIASHLGHTEMVVYFIEIGVKCNQRYGKNMRLPIHEACILGNADIVRLIANRSKDCLDMKDSQGFSAIHICAMNGELRCLQILEEYEASLTIQDNEGLQPTHWAARRDHTAVLHYMLEKDLKVNEKCLLGRTPLHYAAINNSLQALKFLTKSHGDIGIGDFQNATPLHLAAKNGSLGCLRFLASLNIPLSIRQFDGKTPAHLAALTGSHECLHWLLDNGTNVSVTDDENNTIGHMACRSGKGEVIFCFLSHHGPQNILNNLGEDLYQIARRYGHSIKYDLARKAEIVCPLCQLESNAKEWDQSHSPSAVVKSIINSQQSLFKSPLGSYADLVKKHQTIHKEKKEELIKRNQETINIGKEVQKNGKIYEKKVKDGPGYRDLITRYYGEFIHN